MLSNAVFDCVNVTLSRVGVDETPISVIVEEVSRGVGTDVGGVKDGAVSGRFMVEVSKFTSGTDVNWTPEKLTGVMGSPPTGLNAV